MINKVITTCLFIPYYFIMGYSFQINSFSSNIELYTHKSESKVLERNEIYRSDEINLPFRLVANLILIEATIDGQKGNYIMDTASKKMMLNKKYFNGYSSEEIKAYSSSGEINLIERKRVRLNWKDEPSKKYKALITPFNQLEEKLKTKIHGFIGYNVLKNYEIVFDYANRNISLYPNSKRNNSTQQSFRYVETIDTFSLQANSFLPILHMKIGNRTLRFGIDSASSMNILNGKLKKKLKNNFIKLDSQTVCSLNGIDKLVEKVVIDTVKFRDYQWDSTCFLLEKLSELNRQLPKRVDGLLGYCFFEKYKIAINYDKNILMIWNIEKVDVYTVF